MTRHGKNSTAGSVYTYHERQKDSKQSGWGSKEARLGKDSIKEFDCCCLTLQPCKNPVITSDGYLYDKESILEYILQKKRDISRQMKEYEKQKSKNAKEAAELSRAEKESNVKKFVSKEVGVAVGKSEEGAVASGSSVSNMISGKDKALPSFWIPSLTPQAKETQLQKPDEKVRCPMSNKPLRLKDLIEVKFTEIKDGEKKALIVKDARYVCAVTNDVLGNSVPSAVLKTSGSVVTMECIDKIIKKDMVDPLNGKTLQEKDIIPLQRGATGFAGTGMDLKAKKHGAAIMS